MTHKELTRLNNNAIETNRNRTLYPEMIDKLDPKLKIPVIMSMIHNDVEMRVRLILTPEGDSAFLDIPFKDYNKLKEVEIER